MFGRSTFAALSFLSSLMVYVLVATEPREQPVLPTGGEVISKAQAHIESGAGNTAGFQKQGTPHIPSKLAPNLAERCWHLLPVLATLSLLFMLPREGVRSAAGLCIFLLGGYALLSGPFYVVLELPALLCTGAVTFLKY